MILTTNNIINSIKDYANPNDRITRLVKQNKLFRIVRGVYCDEKDAENLYIANAIYNPSYVSFETALGYYDMIPEATFNVSCATCTLTKIKHYKNIYGLFVFRNVPKQVYPLDINVIRNGDYVLYIASPEKALCDQLYKCSICKSIKQLKSLIFDNLRIDEEKFNNLDKRKLIKLSRMYHSTNLNLLIKYLGETNELHN